MEVVSEIGGVAEVLDFGGYEWTASITVPSLLGQALSVKIKQQSGSRDGQETIRDCS